MTYEFTSITFGLYINDEWVDLTPDVLVYPSPKFSRGIMSNKPRDKVGFPGYLDFYLDNSEGNSAGLAGYYSPGHTNCRSGWDTGLPVRLVFGYEGITRYKWYGRIKPQGISPAPDIKGKRNVAVSCGDYMYLIQNHELKSMTFAQAKRADQAVALVVANLPIQPLVTDYHAGVESFPTLFDINMAKTTAMVELNRIALSEWCYIYVIGDNTGGETLVVENQTTRTAFVEPMYLPKPDAEQTLLWMESEDEVLMENNDTILLQDVQIAIFQDTMSEGTRVSYGTSMANRIIGRAYPREVDSAATTVLCGLQKSFRVKAGESVTGYRQAFRDPDNPDVKVCGIELVTPVSGTDYTATYNEDGTGGSALGDLTFTPTLGTDGVYWDITSSASVDVWVQLLQVRGKGVYTYDTIENIKDDTVSQAIHGVVPLTLDFKYQADAQRVDLFCFYLKNKEAFPRMALDEVAIWANKSSLNMYGFLLLEPGEKASFIESQSGLSGEFFIMGYRAEIIAGKYVKWYPILKDDAGYYDYAIWDEDEWDAALTFWV